MSVITIKPFTVPGSSGTEQFRGGSRIQQLQQKLKELNEELGKVATGHGTPEEKEERAEMLAHQILSITQEIGRLQKEEQEARMERKREKSGEDNPVDAMLKAANQLIDIFI